MKELQIIYEQELYSRLKKLTNSIYRKKYGKVERSSLTNAKMIEVSNTLEANPTEDVILLEFEYHVPESFYRNLFPKNVNNSEIPVDYSQLRPDILIVGNQINDQLERVFELKTSGKFKEITNNKFRNRFGISVFDVKKTQREKVGKKHFVEIFYYMWTLAFFLEAQGLQDLFYVRANFNGILPEIFEEEFDLLTVYADFIGSDVLAKINWEESQRIFMTVAKKIRQLWIISPRSIESVSLHIHQGCGYCQYIEDCKKTLGWLEYGTAANWSLKLIPFTSSSIASQLSNEYGCETVNDVYEKLKSIKPGNFPKPIYSELPMLKLKTQALIEKKFVYAEIGKNQTHSYKIPRFSPMTLNFGVEYDANNDKVFSIALYLKMFVFKGLNYHKAFNKWWIVWKNALRTGISSEMITDQLNEFLLRDITVEVVDKFRRILKTLQGLKIELQGEKTEAGVIVEYQFAEINKSDSIQGEAELTIIMVSKLYDLLEFSTIIEDFVEYADTEERAYRPNTCLFYWGQTQLDNFQAMLDRNFNYLVKNETTKTTYQKILLYFSPTDKNIAHPYQQKKLYDVQKFIETSIGVPTIINYTWHDIAKKLFTTNPDFEYKFKLDYWIPHFNFLDLNNWLVYLSLDENTEEKKLLGAEIVKQHLYKLRTIDHIRSTVQQKGRQAISQNSRPKSKADFKSATLPVEYHSIAHVWYLYSLRTSALRSQESEFYRTIFPDFSIAKMKAGKVSDLSEVSSGEKDRYYKFTLRGLSSNMKLKKRDMVLLIPLAKRDLNLGYEKYKWRITIKDIVWDSKINGNRITSELTKYDLVDLCLDDGIPFRDDWYLYPLTTDAWSNKLYVVNSKTRVGLLQLHNFGTSWLGKRLSFLWSVGSERERVLPREDDFSMPSLYLFAPRLLQKIETQEHLQTLTTNIFPPPDASQKRAILSSLNTTVSAILGPPGTGKSQTVAALIDEFLCRRKQQNKDRTIVLVTSFSYPALKVVLEKIREKSKDSSGNPTFSAQTQIIYVRSESQLPIPPVEGCSNVNDVYRKSAKTWRYNNLTNTITPKKRLDAQIKTNCIVFANAHQLYHLKEIVSPDFVFDLICVDEASQMPVDHILSSLQFVHKPTVTVKTSLNYTVDDISFNNLDLNNDLTKVVIVGDNNQLPPVQSIPLPKNLESVLKSLFSYYVEGHGIANEQLEVNYRSHKDIVDFTSTLGFYKNLRPSELNANLTLTGDLTKVKNQWSKIVLNPERVVCSIQHDTKYEVGISIVEATIIAQLVSDYYEMISPKDEEAEKLFWLRKVGVVSPHTAQGRVIIQQLLQTIAPRSQLDKSTLMDYLSNTVYSVEKFQGSDRDLIVTSFGLSDVDKIREECDFIFNINRFNVLTSRAKSKLILISSREFLKYVPDDRKAIENASKIYYYVKKFCNKKMKLSIPDKDGHKTQIKFRYKK